MFNDYYLRETYTRKKKLENPNQLTSHCCIAGSALKTTTVENTAG